MHYEFRTHTERLATRLAGRALLKKIKVSGSIPHRANNFFQQYVPSNLPTITFLLHYNILFIVPVTYNNIAVGSREPEGSKKVHCRVIMFDNEKHGSAYKC